MSLNVNMLDISNNDETLLRDLHLLKTPVVLDNLNFQSTFENFNPNNRVPLRRPWSMARFNNFYPENRENIKVNEQPQSPAFNYGNELLQLTLSPKFDQDVQWNVSTQLPWVVTQQGNNNRRMSMLPKSPLAVLESIVENRERGEVNSAILKLGQRVNSWTRQEECFLIGVVVAKYLTQGTLFASETSNRKRKSTEASTDVSVVDECWNSIKLAFDTVWRKYSRTQSRSRPCERTAKALRRHYKVMKTRLKNGKQEAFHELHKSWRTEHNVNHSLLNPDFFAIQDFLAENKQHKLHSPKRIRLDDGTVQESRLERTMNGTRKESNMSSQSSSTLDSYGQELQGWDLIEEIFLVGVVVDRFIHRGSLVSARSKNTIDNDCWSSIKRRFDSTWQKYATMSGKHTYTQRSVNSLSRQYKLIRQRTISQTKSLLMKIMPNDMEFNTPIAQSSGSDAHFRSLWALYDEWVNKFNRNWCLNNPEAEF